MGANLQNKYEILINNRYFFRSKMKIFEDFAYLCIQLAIINPNYINYNFI